MWSASRKGSRTSRAVAREKSPASRKTRPGSGCGGAALARDRRVRWVGGASRLTMEGGQAGFHLARDERYLIAREIGEERQRQELLPFAFGDRQAVLVVQRIEVNRFVMDAGADSLGLKVQRQLVAIRRADREQVPAAVGVVRGQIEFGHAGQLLQILPDQGVPFSLHLIELLELHEPQRRGDVVHVVLVASLIDVILPPVLPFDAAPAPRAL